MKKLPKYTRNFYFIFGTVFFIWMLVFDGNDLINQFKLTQQLKSLENEKEFYQEKIVEVETARQQFMNNPEALEKYAREEYLMKKANEDIYVIVVED